MIVGGYLIARKELLSFGIYRNLFFLIGLIVSFVLSNLAIDSIDINLVNLIFAGFIAFSFFLIPGISGSAILLIFGFYSIIIESIAILNFTVLLPFGIGASISLLTMPKIISYLFEKNRETIINTLKNDLLTKTYKVYAGVVVFWGYVFKFKCYSA